MSWQDYVDKQLLASRCVTKAAIAGHDGNVWAKSDGFDVSLELLLRIDPTACNRFLGDFLPYRPLCHPPPLPKSQNNDSTPRVLWAWPVSWHVACFRPVLGHRRPARFPTDLNTLPDAFPKCSHSYTSYKNVIELFMDIAFSGKGNKMADHVPTRMTTSTGYSTQKNQPKSVGKLVKTPQPPHAPPRNENTRLNLHVAGGKCALFFFLIPNPEFPHAPP